MYQRDFSDSTVRLTDSPSFKSTRCSLKRLAIRNQKWSLFCWVEVMGSSETDLQHLASRTSSSGEKFGARFFAAFSSCSLSSCALGPAAPGLAALDFPLSLRLLAGLDRGVEDAGVEGTGVEGAGVEGTGVEGAGVEGAVDGPGVGGAGVGAAGAGAEGKAKRTLVSAAHPPSCHLRRSWRWRVCSLPLMNCRAFAEQRRGIR